MKFKHLKTFENFDEETEKNVDEILNHYLMTAIWTEEERLKEENPQMDLTIEDISDESEQKSLEDIKKFLNMVGDAVEGISNEQIGHDLWLTRNGHGVGFWDRGYEEEIDKKLTNAAEELGEVYVVVGDDGKIHFE